MKNEEKKSGGFLGLVERVGNALPHPIYIFVILTVSVVIVSALASSVEFVHPGTGEAQQIHNLVSVDGLKWFLANFVNNFIDFMPLGMVLATMLGVGLAEETGLLRSLLKVTIMGAPKVLVTAVVLFAGIMGNIAGSATFVIIPPLGALVFKALGRHPVAGLCAGFAGVAAGLSANLIITPTDILLCGITETGARILDPEFTVNPAVNWYFMMASTVLLTIVGAIIIEKVVEPKLGKYDATFSAENSDADASDLMTVTDDQKRGLKWAGIVTLVYGALLAMTIVPADGILRGPDGSIVPSTFLSSMVPILTIWFFSTAVAYGVCAKTIKKSDDVIKHMSSAMTGFSGFIVLCFFAAHFVESFSYSNLGLLIAVKGADFLEQSGLIGIPLIICFIILVSFINFFIGSSSAKWAILAPIFVPMLMNVGYSPYFTQVAYRIADSVTNSISPLESFMPFIIICAQKYDKRSGLGTVVASMLPLAGGFLVSWTILLIIWFVLGLPLGPGAGFYL